MQTNNLDLVSHWSFILFYKEFFYFSKNLKMFALPFLLVCFLLIFRKHSDIFIFSFEDLLKAFEKAKPVIAKEEKGVIPIFYIR